MKVLIVVPARYESSRFPGKPLIELTGADGKTKSLVQRSWEAAKSVRNVDVIVATDDSRIEKAAKEFDFVEAARLRDHIKILEKQSTS